MPIQRLRMISINFNPRTPCGVRPKEWALDRLPKNISIHAPLAGCDVVDGIAGKATQISIHAPLAGCDYTEALGETVTYEFQSTHPLRGATAYPPRPWPNGRFQSTHPLRGATRRLRRNARHRAHFNPRTPCGVRPRSIFPRRYRPDFNPRTPCGVRRHGGSLRQRHGDFNPRTPCGVRLRLIRYPDAAPAAFQSTHPLRGATATVTAYNSATVFQSTHPLRGATRR